ncbi:Hypothetical predicted protein [Podarcis lilfordi]|uniref:Uncharacterized protein n=1 Tax=Podarcis lilfordi TaxID=74358 RepID=A0AA35PCH0_9SAUR|nr:Hypothetical predicted protein [Podarcis lilfordi]
MSAGFNHLPKGLWPLQLWGQGFKGEIQRDPLPLCWREAPSLKAPATRPSCSSKDSRSPGKKSGDSYSKGEALWWGWGKPKPLFCLGTDGGQCSCHKCRGLWLCVLTGTAVALSLSTGNPDKALSCPLSTRTSQRKRMSEGEEGQNLGARWPPTEDGLQRSGFEPEVSFGEARSSPIKEFRNSPTPGPRGALSNPFATMPSLVRNVEELTIHSQLPENPHKCHCQGASRSRPPGTQDLDFV